MYVTGAKLCYFVVYTSVDLVFTLVELDPAFLNQNLPKAKTFWNRCVLPETLARFFTSKQREVCNTAESHLPCFCQKNQNDVDVVICARTDCARKKFHIPCIKTAMGIQRVLIGRWRCDVCRKIVEKEKRCAAKTIKETS